MRLSCSGRSRNDYRCDDDDDNEQKPLTKNDHQTSASDTNYATAVDVTRSQVQYPDQQYAQKGTVNSLEFKKSRETFLEQEIEFRFYFLFFVILLCGDSNVDEQRVNSRTQADVKNTCKHVSIQGRPAVHPPTPIAMTQPPPSPFLLHSSPFCLLPTFYRGLGYHPEKVLELKMPAGEF